MKKHKKPTYRTLDPNEPYTNLSPKALSALLEFEHAPDAEEEKTQEQAQESLETVAQRAAAPGRAIEKHDQAEFRRACIRSLRALKRLKFKLPIRRRIQKVLACAPTSRNLIADTQALKVVKKITAALEVRTQDFFDELQTLEDEGRLPRGTVTKLTIAHGGDNPYLRALAQVANELGLWAIDPVVIPPKKGHPTFLPWFVLADVLRDEIRRVSPRRIMPHVGAILQPLLESIRLPGGKKSGLYSDPASLLKNIRKQAALHGREWDAMKERLVRRAGL